MGSIASPVPVPTPPPTDPNGVASDKVTATVIGILAVPFVLANIVLIVYRKWTPIKHKMVRFTVLGSIGGLIWIFATVITLNLFPRTGVLSLCQLFTFWLQLALGSCLWLNCLNVQLYRFNCRFLPGSQLAPRADSGYVYQASVWASDHVFAKHLGKHYLWLFLLILQLPILLVSLAASVVHPSRWDPAFNDCKFNSSHWPVAVWIILPFYFLVWAVLSFRVRKIRDSLNEYKPARDAGLIGLVLFVMVIILRVTTNYQRRGGRALGSLAVATEVYYYFWIRCGKLVYIVLHKAQRDRYLAEYNVALKHAGLVEDEDDETKRGEEEMELESMRRLSQASVAHPQHISTDLAMHAAQGRERAIANEVQGLRDQAKKLELQLSLLKDAQLSAQSPSYGNGT